MRDFKNTTRTISGHHFPAAHGFTGSAPPTGVNGVTSFRPSMGGNALVQRDTAPTAELQDAGGTSPLRAGFKKGGGTKHFHVHKHFHAKGGKTHSVSHSYAAAEKHAETFAAGGSVHDNTTPPAGGPDYKKGGRTKVRKNAGGALYATGGTINKLALGGVPMQGAPAAGALGRMALRPGGLPMRGGPPMRRPMMMPGPAPVMRARGGPTGMRTVAKQEVRKHVATPPPRGHGIK